MHVVLGFQTDIYKSTIKSNTCGMYIVDYDLFKRHPSSRKWCMCSTLLDLHSYSIPSNRVLFSVTPTHTDEPFFVSYDFTSEYGHLSVLSFAVALFLNLH